MKPTSINVRLRNQNWKLRFCHRIKNQGYCQRLTKTIWILRKLDGELKLDRIIHECLYASEWNKVEPFIELIAGIAAECLVYYGWIDDDSHRPAYNEVDHFADDEGLLARTLLCFFRLASPMNEETTWEQQAAVDIARILIKLGYYRDD